MALQYSGPYSPQRSSLSYKASICSLSSCPGDPLAAPRTCQPYLPPPRPFLLEHCPQNVGGSLHCAPARMPFLHPALCAVGDWPLALPRLFVLWLQARKHWQEAGGGRESWAATQAGPPCCWAWAVAEFQPLLLWSSLSPWALALSNMAITTLCPSALQEVTAGPACSPSLPLSHI